MKRVPGKCRAFYGVREQMRWNLIMRYALRYRGFFDVHGAVGACERKRKERLLETLIFRARGV
jgi:hypothetical protein